MFAVVSVAISKCDVMFFLNSQEILADIFSEYGEIARVYVPVDLDHNCRSKGFAFVRFVKEADARRAAEEMNGIHLGIGRPITTKLNYQKSYFSQDESPPPRPRKKPGVVMHFDP